MDRATLQSLLNWVGVRGVLTLDFESYYDAEYSLRNMTTQEYILDPRFEIHGVSVARDNGEATWLEQEVALQFIGQVDWSQFAVAAHNTWFDVGILSLRYGKRPGFIIDSMAMAQALLAPYTGRVGLDTTANYLGYGRKIAGVVGAFKGKRWAWMPPALKAEIAQYGGQDADLCRYVWQHLVPFMPASELQLIDATVRLFTEPKFELDVKLLQEHYNDVLAEKQALLDAAYLQDRTALMSNDTMAAMLSTLGVEPPMKASPSDLTKTIYAFAKTDKAFTDLLEHPSPMVQAVVAARLGHKSTIEETRTKRLLGIGEKHGWIGVPLRYAAAHTHRFGGADKLNLQNLPRPTKDKPSKLRKALRAPKGFMTVVVDAAQIEARMNAWFCEEWELVKRFAANEDVYSWFASKIYGYEVTKATHEFPERFVGKQGILSLGYTAGADKFFFMLQSYKVNQVDRPMAGHIVDVYRSTFKKIKKRWYHLNDMIPRVMATKQTVHLGPVRFEGGDIYLPNGMALRYPGLEFKEEWENNWFYRRGKQYKKIFGGKLLENIIQALARIVVTDAWLACKKAGIPIALTVHDELVAVVPEAHAVGVCEFMTQEVARRPQWALDCPLAAEGHFAVAYGDAK